MSPILSILSIVIKSKAVLSKVIISIVAVSNIGNVTVCCIWSLLNQTFQRQIKKHF
jgi:hypothetical protein